MAIAKNWTEISIRERHLISVLDDEELPSRFAKLEKHEGQHGCGNDSVICGERNNLIGALRRRIHIFYEPASS